MSDTTERMLEGLDDAQREAVLHPEPPLRIIAGAGAGKTRVLTRRIAYQSAIDAIDPRRVLALTFTRKAAGELNSRLRGLGLRDSVAAGTFHGIAYAQLRRYWADNNRTAPGLLDRKAPLVARVLPRGLGDTAVLDVISEIEWAKARVVSPDAYEDAAHAADRRPPASLALMAEAYRRYEQEKKERRVVDFDDLLSLCRRALETDTEFGSAQRWRFRHLFVDEFQDVNPSQFTLLKAWLGSSADLCVVGDPRQAIYSWNGADATYINDFDQHFPGAASVELRNNYRSTPQVMAIAQAVLRGASNLAPTVATKPAGPLPRVKEYENDVDEARGIARAVRDAHDPGKRWADQAVLVRTNGQIPVLEEALRKAKIPFRTRGGGLLRLPEARSIIRGLERSPQPLASSVTDLAVASDDDDLQTDGPEAPDTRRVIVDTIVRLATEYLSIDPSATGSAFSTWLQTTTGGDDVNDKSDAIDIATFHAAKGLEWAIVHIAGVEQGLVPISYARTPDAQAEEQRLFYVAVTRAEHTVLCSWSKERQFGNRVSTRSPSPYLRLVEDALDVLTNTTRPVDNRQQVAAQRKKLGSSAGTKTDNNDPLYVALKSWRSTASRAANVPAYVVFHDATLEAIATSKPKTRAALGRVPGIGPVKLDRYAEELLRIVKETVH
ncbi:MAG: ATP-dependent DNA helicase UvrD2 [Acidimicrobiales bacterium]